MGMNGVSGELGSILQTFLAQAHSAEDLERAIGIASGPLATHFPPATAGPNSGPSCNCNSR